MPTRTVELIVVLDVDGSGELAGSALVTSLMTNHKAIRRIAVVGETEGEPEAVEGRAWLEVNAPKEAING